MARIGTPLAKTSAGARGLPASGTDAGPPDRITAFGFSRAKASEAFENGWISQKTPASRTRRAISCVTCEPKSTMRTKSWLMRPHVAQRAAGRNGGGGPRGRIPTAIVDSLKRRSRGLDELRHFRAPCDRSRPSTGDRRLPSVDHKILAVDEPRPVTCEKDRRLRDIVRQTRSRNGLNRGETLLHHASDLVGLRALKPCVFAKDSGHDRSGREGVDANSLFPQLRRSGAGKCADRSFRG